MKSNIFSKTFFVCSLLILVVFTNVVQAQNDLTFPKNSKKGDKFVTCMKTDGTMGALEKVISVPTEKEILKIQKKLQFLKFEVIETGIYDTQTQKALQAFDEQQGIKNPAMEGILTEQMKSRLFKAYRKEKRMRKKSTKS